MTEPSYPPPPYASYGGWQAPPQPTGPGGRPLADFGTRLAAYLIDGVIVTLATIIVATAVMVPVVMFLLPETSGWNSSGVPDSFVFTVISIQAGLLLLMLALYWTYFVELMFRSGQTVGKRVMKLRVVPLDPGVELTRGIAARRFLVQHVGGVLIPFFSYLDGLWQLWDKPFLQTLHDKFAKTVVIKVAP